MRIGIDYGSLCSSGFLGYLAGYCHLGYQRIGLALDFFGQVTFPSATPCSLFDSKVRNIVLICNLAQRFYSGTVVKLDALPACWRGFASRFCTRGCLGLFWGLDTDSLDAMYPMLQRTAKIANPSRVMLITTIKRHPARTDRLLAQTQCSPLADAKQRPVHPFLNSALSLHTVLKRLLLSPHWLKSVH